ncbi:NADP-dependent oxidoreductase [Thioclava marina]|uniref:NADP-dependent oxidoreductase n=1 Tax=Thioclava marina TaxID=1915077 RepID=UPI001B80C515|nr:NADP-dependent oxidoreductase [Thioclava marina]
MILRTDVSGEVEAVASDVEDFAVGNEAFSMVRSPSFGDSRANAQYVTAPVSHVAHKPAELLHIDAAAAPMALLTAWQFLFEPDHDHPNPLQPGLHRPVPLEGRKVLIIGAAGGVGHFAVQIAKLKSAHVTAVASTTHEAFLRDLGTDAFIDYTQSPPEKVARDLDLVLDMLGGPSTGRFLRILKRAGALFPVFLGFRDTEETTARGVTVSATQVRSSGAQLQELGVLLADGTIRAAIDSTWPLEEASAAHERAAKGHIRGKIVLTVA